MALAGGCGGGGSAGGGAGGGSGSHSGGDVPSLTADPHAATGAQTTASGLKPHPRIVIAAAPGQLPPGAQFAYAGSEGSDDYQPPSDTEVRRELHDLHVAGLGSSGDYVNP